MVEDRIVDENKIHTIYVCMEILYLHILSKEIIFLRGALINNHMQANTT